MKNVSLEMLLANRILLERRIKDSLLKGKIEFVERDKIRLKETNNEIKLRYKNENSK